METKTVAAFKRYIGCREDLWEAAFRNGFVLPKVNASICTEEYLRKVIDEVYYCPKDVEIKSKNCFAPPSKQTLLEKLKKVAVTMKIDLGITDKHVPDKSWMVKVLANLNCKDEIFAKDYIPPPVKRKKDDPKVISLPSGFL